MTTNCNEFLSSFHFWASIHYEEKYRCVGTIVNGKFVLTVADRVIEAYGAKSYGKFAVRVGTLDTDAGGTICHVEKVHFHPRFDAKRRLDRVAIIELQKNVTSEDVKSVVLVDEDEMRREASWYLGVEERINDRLYLISWEKCMRKSTRGEDKFCAEPTNFHDNPMGAVVCNLQGQQFGIGTEILLKDKTLVSIWVAIHRNWIALVTEGRNVTSASYQHSEWKFLFRLILTIVILLSIYLVIFLTVYYFCPEQMPFIQKYAKLSLLIQFVFAFVVATLL